MQKLSKNEMKEIEKKMSFYNFKEFSSYNNSCFIVKFKEDICNITYSDLQYGGNAEIYECKKELLISFMKDIFMELNDDFIIIRKYEEKWITDKKSSNELSIYFQKNLISNKFEGGIKIGKLEGIISRFIESVLKYNSFCQFLFQASNLIITPTDHMDIFINTKDMSMIHIILNRYLEKQKYQDLYLAVV